MEYGACMFILITNIQHAIFNFNRVLQRGCKDRVVKPVRKFVFSLQLATEAWYGASAFNHVNFLPPSDIDCQLPTYLIFGIQRLINSIYNIK